MRTKLGLVWPCVRFWKLSKEREYQPTPKTALLEPCEAAVPERGKPNKPKTDDTRPLPL